MRPATLVVLPYRLEAEDDDRLVVHALASDQRLELSAGFRLFLDAFSAPCEVASFVSAHADLAAADELLAGLDTLIERGLLVDAAWRDRLKDLRLAQPAHAAFSFERVPVTALLSDRAAEDAVFFGVPVDIATTGAPGARNGPAAVRWHTQQRSLGSGRYLDEADELVRRVDIKGAVDIGDLALKAGEGIDSVVPRIRTVAQLATRQGALLCAVGGDHSITWPLLGGLVASRRARGEARPLCVVQFDAHADLPRSPPSPFDAVHSHASFMRHVIDDGLVDLVVQIGLRSVVPDPAANKLAIEPHVVGVNRAMRIERAALLALIPDDHDLYLTVDIDVVDPAFAPHTGTPQPGGLPSWRLLELCCALVEERRLVGIDVVEVAGPAAAENTTAALAAHLLQHVLLRKFGVVER